MQSESIKQLMVEMAERRKLHEQALKEVQKSVVTFKNGLTDVKFNLQSTAQRFSNLVQETGIMNQEPIILELYRRAS